MKIRLLLQVVAAIGLFALSIPACTTQEPEFINTKEQLTEEVTLLSNAQLQQWYEAQNGSLNKGTPLQTNRATTAEVPVLNWSLATNTHIGAEHISLVPFADSPDQFAGSGYHGYRYLLIVQKAQQEPKAAIIEVLATNPYSAVTSQTLFLDLYRKGKTRAALPQQTFTGFVFFYTLRYEFQAGRGYIQGHVVAGKPQLLRSGNPTGGKPSGTAQTMNTCTYVVVSHDPPYSVNVCDSGGGGSGGGGFGGGGGGGAGGNGPPPSDYPELPADGGGGGVSDGSSGYSSVPNMPPTMTMPKQISAGSCVPSSLSQVKLALCGGNQTADQIEAAMLLYGIQQYGTSFINDGVPLSGIGSFVSQFFHVDILQPANNFWGAINAGRPIMIDVFSHMDGPGTAVYHSVVVTGYNPSDPTQIYYLDPATGTTHIGNATSLYSNSHYAIPITGCK